MRCQDLDARRPSNGLRRGEAAGQVVFQPRCQVDVLCCRRRAPGGQGAAHNVLESAGEECSGTHLTGSGAPAITHAPRVPGASVAACRALRVMRLSLLAGELNGMHLSSSGALLSGAASIRLLQLVASVLTLLFTTSSIVHLVERIPFHDALYFVTTTLTTARSVAPCCHLVCCLRPHGVVVSGCHVLWSHCVWRPRVSTHV